MTAMLQMLDEWLHAKEDEHLEFKEAKQNFHFETLVKYCVALVNEGGVREALLNAVIRGVYRNRKGIRDAGAIPI